MRTPARPPRTPLSASAQSAAKAGNPVLQALDHGVDAGSPGGNADAPPAASSIARWSGAAPRRQRRTNRARQAAPPSRRPAPERASRRRRPKGRIHRAGPSPVRQCPRTGGHRPHRVVRDGRVVAAAVERRGASARRRGAIRFRREFAKQIGGRAAGGGRLRRRRSAAPQTAPRASRESHDVAGSVAVLRRRRRSLTACLRSFALRSFDGGGGAHVLGVHLHVFLQEAVLLVVQRDVALHRIEVADPLIGEIVPGRRQRVAERRSSRCTIRRHSPRACEVGVRSALSIHAVRLACVHSGRCRDRSSAPCATFSIAAGLSAAAKIRLPCAA